MIRALLLSAAALIAAPALAQTVAITGATVALGDGSAPIQNATLVFRDGRIIAAGSGVAAPAGAEVIDAHGKWVSPGLVAGFTGLGLHDANGIEIWTIETCLCSIRSNRSTGPQSHGAPER